MGANPIRRLSLVLRRGGSEEMSWPILELPLPHSLICREPNRRLISEVAGIVPSVKKSLLDVHATETNLKALPLENYRVIHLAVHVLPCHRAARFAEVFKSASAGDKARLFGSGAAAILKTSRLNRA